MAKPTDISSKRLVSLVPDEWVQWVTNLDDLTVIDLIDAQFQWISRDSDVLIKVESPQHGQFLILNEWQLHYDRDIAYRIRAYAGLAEEKYRIPVYPLLVNILRPSPGTAIGNRFQSNFMGLQARQDYQVINLWQVDAEVAFNESLAALLPLVPVMNEGNDENILRPVAIALEGQERFEDLLQLLGTFAIFVLGVNNVERIMGLQAEALRASPLGILLKEEGKKEEAQRMLTILLQWRFGDVPESLQATLRSLSADRLEELATLLLQGTSLDEFIASISQEVERN